MRVISNTFSLTAVPDVQASRPNLVHCSQFTKDRLGWWILPDRSNAWSFGVESGMYGIDGYNAYGVLAQPGMIADVRQYLAKEYRSSQADYNNETSNYALDAGKWYTLSFKARGIAKKKNSDGSYSDGGETRLYVYLVGYNGGGVSIVDTSEKYIVDGVEKSPSGDMNTSFVLNWTVATHTITFKTRSDLKTISNHAVPVLYFRSFGEGHTTYPTYFANGGCLFRIAAIKIEEGMEATAYTPHATEMQPPVHAVAFKRENTDISGTTPTGGTYTSPTPTGWSDGIPTGEARLWETKAVFVPELPSATWSKPSPVGDTSDSDVEFSPYDGTPVSDVSNNLAAAGTAATSTTNKWFDPVRNAGADFSKMIWRAERQKKNGVWDEKWAIVKVKGETGEKGEDGKSGEDAVTIDIDNEMDSVPVNNEGVLTYNDGSRMFTVFFNVKMYKGASEISTSLITAKTTSTELAEYKIEGVTPACVVSDSKIYYSYTFETGQVFSKEKYETRLPFVYGGITYYTAFTLNAVRSGAKGEDAVIYQLVPSNSAISFKRDSGGSPTGSYTLTCRVRQTVGGISSVGSVPRGYSIKYGTNNENPCTGDFDSSKTISASEYADKENIVLELYKDETTLMDRETIPILIDGSKGENGNPGSPGTDATMAWLDCPYLAIQCDKDGISKVASFNVKAYKRVGDNPAQATDSSYKLSYTVSHTNSSDETIGGNTGNSTNGTLTVNIGKTYKLKEVAINLSYSGNIIQTIILLPVLDGALGADGYSYLPQVLGEYSPTQEYKWDESVRQGCYYATDGRYNIYYVRKKQTTLKGVAPNGTTEDENWEQSYRIFTIFTDAIYTPNANIGGFYLTRNLFMSSEKAREYIWVNKNFKYYGKYSKGVSYTADRDIIYSGGYYLCKTGHTSTSDTPVSDFWTNLDSITTTNKKEYLKKAVVGKPRNVTITDGVWISAVCDIGSGYMTVKYNRNGGWMVFVNNGTSASDPSSTAKGWRYLTETECAILGITSGVTALEYNYKKFDIPRYALNGVTGTPTTFLSDDSVWTYNNSGKLIIGKENRLRVELSPKEGGLSFFNNENKQVITVDASTLSSSNIFGSSQGSFTTSTVNIDYYEDSAGSTYEHYLTYQVTDTAVFTGQIELTYKGEMTAFAGLPNASVTPRSYCNLNLCLCKYDKDSNTYQIVKEIVALYSGGIAKRQSISGSVIFNGDGGTYCLCLYAQYWQRYSDNRLYYSLTSFSCGYSAISNVTRVYANGFALGNSSTNHFAAFNDGGNIRVKGITNEGKYGYELDANKGLLVTRNKLQGIVPMLVYYAFVTDSGSALSITLKYSFNGKTLEGRRDANGKYTFKIPSSWSEGGMDFETNLIPTVICNGTTTGVSAQIYALTKTSITIWTANDNSLDNSNLIIKLEYIG